MNAPYLHLEPMQESQSWLYWDEHGCGGRGLMDDFGTLIRIDTVRDRHWALRGVDTHETCDPAEAHEAFLDNLYPLRHLWAAQEKATLARPAPVIATVDAHDWHTARITITSDPRIDVPTYLLEVGGEQPLLVSHAQLAALLVAAESIVGAPAGAAA